MQTTSIQTLAGPIEPPPIAGQNNTIISLLDDFERIQPLWDRFVDEHPKASAFHTSEMVRAFQGARGHRPLALASLTSGGAVTAILVSVRVQTLPSPMGWLSSRSVFYAEPLCKD